MSVTVDNIALPAPVTASGSARRTVSRRLAGALSTLATVALVMLAGVAVVIAAASHLSPDGEYVVFGHPVMSVLSGSMTPTIRTGDLIVDQSVTPYQAAHLRAGQIISVREAAGSSMIITHRIAAVRHVDGVTEYVTKGDANNAPDATVRPAVDVIGVYESGLPHGGYILRALHDPMVLGMLLSAIALCFLAGALLRLARNGGTCSESAD